MMDRKIGFKIIAITVIFLVVGIMIFGISKILTERKDANVLIQRFTDLKEQIIFIDDLKKIDDPTIFIYYNSECEHCIWELTNISKNINSFSESTLILTSFQPVSETDKFLQHTKLSNIHNVYRARIEPENVGKILGSSILPQVFIYKNNKLNKHFKGEVKIEKILEQL